MGILYVRQGGAGGSWLPITGVGTNPGLTQPQADALYVNTTGDTMTGALTVNNGGVYIGGSNHLYWSDWGGGWYMADANWIRAVNNKGVYTAGNMQADAGITTAGTVSAGTLKLPNHTVNTDVYRMTFTPDSYTACAVSIGEYYTTAAVVGQSGPLTVAGNGNVQFKNVDSTRWGYIDNNGFTLDGGRRFTTNGNIQADGSVNTGTLNTTHATGGGWCRFAYYGFSGADGDTYIDNPADGHMRFINNGVVGLEGHRGYGAYCIPGANGWEGGLRLYGLTDGNHGIRYYSGINGVEVDGYAKVRLYNVVSGWYYDFDSDGYGRAPYGWVAYSSIDIKENIEPLSDEQATDIVRSLQPVTFDMRDGTAHDQVGFISEWTEDVAPFAVAKAAGEETHAGIDYGKFTPVLTKVMQTVLDRLDALEANQ